MARNFDQHALEHAAVLLKVAGRYSGDELDAALKAARRAIECSLKEIDTESDASRALIEAIEAARSIVRNRG
jgi:hypothetical protein